MKKRVITGLLVGLLLATGLTSCGSKEEKEDKKDTTSIVDLQQLHLVKMYQLQLKQVHQQVQAQVHQQILQLV